MRNVQIRPESAFYFFKGAVCQTPESAVTTLVTYRKRKKLVPVFMPPRLDQVKAIQRMYHRLTRSGKLTLRGVIQ
jgi:hypothetical protein